MSTGKPSTTQAARHKALHTYVFISGLSGYHTLETGLAYYYRGHYIYAYPAGTLIEPVPYSTRKGIMIQGIVSPTAPVWDGEKEGLVSETEVRALERSVVNEQRVAEELAESKAKETTNSVASTEAVKTSDTPPLSLLGLRGGAEGLPPPLSSLAGLRESPLNTFTPQFGAKFLAASAPGSRLGSRTASPSGLRPVSSHVGLARLGAIKGDSSIWSSSRESGANSPTEDDAASSLPASVGYLFGLRDHALRGDDFASSAGARGGARVAPCAIHGEECDGVATAGLWLTEQTKARLGFVEEVPQIDVGGRVMVDWFGLLGEESAEGS